MDTASRPLECLAIIPARGGSKGIPRKNVRAVAGQPLVSYTIEQARRASAVDRVVVSTDDPEIAAISSRYGAEVIWRPPEISDDHSPSELALLHVLQHLEHTESYRPDLLVFLQCTSPLTLAEDIDGTIGALLSRNADSALAVAPFHHFIWGFDASGDAVSINHDKRSRPMRQQREPQFLETGAVYVMRTEGFLLEKHRFFGEIALYSVPAERCLEIDGPTDLAIAEFLLLDPLRRSTPLPDPVSALVLDFDGVLTDNRVITLEDGTEAAVCSRSDGWGLARIKELGLPVLVLSAETNPLVEARCAKLKIECQHGVADKEAALLAWLGDRGLDLNGVVYVGNDVNDLGCLRAVGLGVAVADAHPQAKAAARLVLSASGGQGAAREIADLIQQRMGADRYG